jgi:branched-subunit amino acid aminotransferase/4-amino-4-deoxychorismate lyase
MRPEPADDALMLDHRGFVAETNATNITLVTECVLGTPSPAASPEGITRGAVLELAAGAGIAGDYSLTQLYAADELFVTGTMGGIAPVISLDGRQVGDGSPGPVTLRLTKLWRSWPRARVRRSYEPGRSVTRTRPPNARANCTLSAPPRDGR